MRCHPGEILGWHEEPLLVTLEEPARRGPEALLAIGLEELPQERQIEDSKPGRRLDELLQAPDAIGMPEPIEQRVLGARDAKAPAAPIDRAGAEHLRATAAQRVGMREKLDPGGA